MTEIKWRSESPLDARVNRKTAKNTFWPVTMRQAFTQSDNPDKVTRNYSTRAPFHEGTTSYKNSNNLDIRMAWTAPRAESRNARNTDGPDYTLLILPSRFDAC